MKKILTALLIVLCYMSLQVAKAENDPTKSLSNKVTNDKSKLYSDYKNAKKKFDYEIGKPVDFYIDFQVGAGTTNANISKGTSAKSDYQTKSKLGYITGALVYINIFDVISFSTGLTFEGKSFTVTPPNISIPYPGYDSSSVYIPNNYLNIPLNFNIGGMITENVGLTFNGGPYLGILLSKPGNIGGLGYKNFDLGLNATLTANYVFLYPFSVILGTKFEYGGLNSLGSTQTVDKITTTNFTFFTGMRFSL
jgi:hypothetical protein